MVNGKVVMYNGYVCGKGSQIITTALGEKHIRERGLESVVVDLAESGFYQGI